MRAVLGRPHAGLGVEHVAAREHAHVVRRRAGQLVQRIEAAAGKDDALGVREAGFAHVRGVVVDHRHAKAHVRGQRRDFAGRVRRAQQPHAHLLEQRDGKPGEAFELLVVHRRPARDVLHLKRIACGMRARRHDLLRIVAEEHERLAVGGTLVAVLLRHLVVGVGLGLLCIVDHLEAYPGKVAFVDGAHGAFEHDGVGFAQAARDHVRVRRIDMLVARKGLRRKAREVVGGQDGRAARPQISRHRSEHVPHHAICTFLSSPTVTRPSAIWRSTSG